MTIAELAARARAGFTTVKRGDDTIYTLRDDARDTWINALAFAAHDGMLPDDYIFSEIVGALDALAGMRAEDDLSDVAHEFADNAVSVYSAGRLAWFSSNVLRSGLVDEACEDLGRPDSILDAIAYGWYREAEQVFQSVLSSLEERIDAEGE